MTRDEFLELVVRANEDLFLEVRDEIPARAERKGPGRDKLMIESFGAGAGGIARWIWDHFDLKEKVRS